MGYFDGLVSGNFKTAQDRSKLFFPWGILGSGYAISSEADYRRLRQQVKGYIVVSLVLIIASASLLDYPSTFVLVVPLSGFYLVWMRYALRRLKKSDERLSLQESMTSQAQAHKVVILWLLEIFSVAFVAVAVVMLVVDPDKRLLALASIFLFGLCAAKIARMLVLRRRAAITHS
jgi:threonine/homoserine/homoserine lactone efflux protein